MSTKNRKKRRIWLSVLIVFLVIVGGTGAYAFKMYHDVAKTTDNIYYPVNTEDVRDTDVSISDQEPFSILLLGVDTGDFGRTEQGRSDSIMIITVNPNENSTKILSIPRDALVEIVGHGTKDKINHAYAFGGVEMSINTVQKFLDIPIDYYVEINMKGIKKLVDTVGGIEVENTLDFTYEEVHFPVGKNQLDGENALKYSRMRYDDPNGDFGRQARQRQVIEAIIKKAAAFSTVTKYGEILAAMEDSMQTNVTLDEIISISKDYHSVLGNIEELQLTGTGEKIDGIYYQTLSDEEVSKASAELRKHLELG